MNCLIFVLEDAEHLKIFGFSFQILIIFPLVEYYS